MRDPRAAVLAKHRDTLCVDSLRADAHRAFGRKLYDVLDKIGAQLLETQRVGHHPERVVAAADWRHGNSRSSGDAESVVVVAAAPEHVRHHGLERVVAQRATLGVGACVSTMQVTGRQAERASICEKMHTLACSLDASSCGGGGRLAYHGSGEQLLKVERIGHELFHPLQAIAHHVDVIQH